MRLLDRLLGREKRQDTRGIERDDDAPSAEPGVWILGGPADNGRPLPWWPGSLP